jgi:glycosidase
VRFVLKVMVPVTAATVLACATALPAAAAVPAEAAVHKGPAKFKLMTLGSTPKRVRAGSRFRVRGRVGNARGRRAHTARVTFSLRRNRRTPAGRGWHLRGTNIERTKGGRSRSFSVRVRVPRRVRAGRYSFFACVRLGSGWGTASCRSRRMTVTRRRGAGSPGAPNPGQPPGPGGGMPSDGAMQSLRGPVTDENFYFVMADRFQNGRTDNDTGGLSGGRLQHGFDPQHKGFYHGGDLKGMRDELDYIEDLGTTSIWLTPSFKNRPVQGPAGQETAGYHGYWVTDFTQIDPHLGTNEELRSLIDAAHARGMKVYFDIITNHTADVIDYEEKQYAYVPKDEEPFRTAGTRTPFDDLDYAGTDTFPPLDREDSFPYTPFFNDAADATVKKPDWLNDVTLYHNRGDTTFAGEDALYGDFFGLDDLFTEHPAVVDGMEDIYTAWIRDFGIDGFRIDTMKHVNDEFWQEFAPDVLEFARAQGKREFFMFGEVFDTTKRFTSRFTTRDRVQAVLDFPFQEAARDFASRSRSTAGLRDFFQADDWYTDADSNAYQLPTFLGNHDMGHVGMFIRDDNAGAAEAELLQRDVLAHELMYLARGNPVVYFGDEQGFTGSGNDQAARQDMFANPNDYYDNETDAGTSGDDGAGKNDNIGSNETPVEDNFDTGHPLYRSIADLARLTREHRALRDGPQQHRHSTDGPGVYAFSRLDRAGQREYVVALNNSEQAQTALIPTAARGGAPFDRIYGEGASDASTDGGGRLRAVVPPLSTVVFRSRGPIPRSASAPDVGLAVPADGEPARDRVEARAFVSGDSFYDVTFQARVGDGPWAPIGTDDNEPYRVFHDIAALEPGTPVQYRAVVLDNAGHTRVGDVGTVQVAEPAIRMTSPTEGGSVRNDVRLAAEATPDRNHYSVRFERSVDGGDWTEVGTDGSQPVYTATDDVSSLAAGTPLRYRAILTYASGRNVTSAVRSTSVGSPVTTAVVHYNRPAGDYADWGLHLWGNGKAGPDTSWDAPEQRDGVDAYGAVYNIPLADETQPVNFIMHRPSGDSVPETREPGGDRSFVPIDHPEIWLKQGDPQVYFSPPPP